MAISLHLQPVAAVVSVALKGAPLRTASQHCEFVVFAPAALFHELAEFLDQFCLLVD